MKHMSTLHSPRLRRVLCALADSGDHGLTTMQIITRAHVTHPVDVVYELRRLGVPIASAWTTANGTRCRRYWIAAEAV